MLSTLSSNAILSKARAMYGKRLTGKDYQSMLGCKTVGEVAGYLKNHTSYSDMLTGVDEAAIHRGQLEMMLRQRIFYDLASLCRYELSVGERFADYILVRSEIQQILRALTLLEGEGADEYLFSLPLFLDKHTHIDLHALAKMKNYHDFLNALGHSPYRRLLEPFAPHPGEAIDITAVENALYGYLYSVVRNIIEHTRSKIAREQLNQIFTSYIDLQNYVRIVRLKKYYHANPDYIRSLQLPFGRLKESTVNEMILAESERQVTAIMKRTPLGKRSANVEYSYIDEIPLRYRFYTCEKSIRYSVYPPVVMLSYIFLTEFELSNIIHIVEGIRYGLPADDIKKLLIMSR